MGAARTVLTHFSARYPKLPVLSSGTCAVSAVRVSLCAVIVSRWIVAEPGRPASSEASQQAEQTDAQEPPALARHQSPLRNPREQARLVHYYEHQTAVAFDLMAVNLAGHLRELPRLKQALRVFFETEGNGKDPVAVDRADVTTATNPTASATNTITNTNTNAT